MSAPNVSSKPKQQQQQAPGSGSGSGSMPGSTNSSAPTSFGSNAASNRSQTSTPNTTFAKHRRSSSKSVTGKRSNSTDSNSQQQSQQQPSQQQQAKLSHNDQSIVSKHMDDRTLFLLSNAIGSKCIVTVTSGTRFLGLLYTTSSFIDSSISVILKFPELYSLSTDDEMDPNDDELPETLYIESKDFADLEILDLDLTTEKGINSYSPAAVASPVPSNGNNFKTDVDIGASRFRTNDQQERELERWVPEADENILQGGLEDDITSASSSSGGGRLQKNWDQFAVNEKKFGIQSTFDEEMYTTKISKDDPRYQERLSRAEKLAREIENSGHNGNLHLAEERGIVVDDSGVDEEDKYSGVDRRGEELMAALRSGAAPPDSTTTTAAADPEYGSREFSPNKYVPPRLRAAAYHDDPAILSSTDVKEKKSEKKLPDTLPQKPEQSVVPTAAAAAAAAASSNIDTSRINAQSEINALKEFSANFKISTKFPKELLPIVTKDKSKQEEILKKFEQEEKEAKEKSKKVAAAAAAADGKEKEKQNSSSTTTSVSSTSTAPAVATATAAATASAAVPAKKKMDPKTAITFKMNPSAAAFQPSGFTPPIRSSFNNNSRSPSAAHASPRMSHSSPAAKKQVTPANFFGSRVPKQGERNEIFKQYFNLYIKLETVDKLDKPFVTAPTWDAEIDETYMNMYELVPEKLNIPAAAQFPQPPAMRYYPGAAAAAAAAISPIGSVAGIVPMVGSPMSPQHQHQQQTPPMPLHQAGGGGIPMMMAAAPPPGSGPIPTFASPEEVHRNLSPSLPMVPQYYAGAGAGGGPIPGIVPVIPGQQQQQQFPPQFQTRTPPSQQQLDPSTSPRAHRHNHNNNNNNHRHNNNNSHHNHNNHNQYNQQAQAQAQAIAAQQRAQMQHHQQQQQQQMMMPPGQGQYPMFVPQQQMPPPPPQNSSSPRGSASGGSNGNGGGGYPPMGYYMMAPPNGRQY